MMDNVRQIFTAFRREYAKTPIKLKLLDGFMVYALSTAAVQFLYLLVVGSFPFNAFLSGFLCSMSVFVFTLCLRMQTDEENAQEFKFSTERAFGDYCLAMLTLFLVTWNYIG